MALSRADKLALLQEAEVDERPAGLTREQKIALLEQEETPKPKAGLRDDVTFLGSEKLGEFMSGIFPRTAKSVAEGESYGKQVLGAGLDQLSAGRAVASLPEFRKGGRAYMESLADTEGDSFVGKTLRDPGTGAALLTAPVGGAALGAMRGTGLATRLAAGAGVGAMEGAASAAAHQGERVNRGQGVDLGAAALETGVSAVAPAVIGGVLKGGLKLANKALGKAAQEFSGVSEEALRAYGTGLG